MTRIDFCRPLKAASGGKLGALGVIRVRPTTLADRFENRVSGVKSNEEKHSKSHFRRYWMMTTFHRLGPGSDLVISPRSMDRLFERFFGYGATNQEDGTPTYALPVDILETEDAYQLHATVAGVPEDGVEVTFEGGMLSIAVKAPPFDVQGKLIRQERPWGNWSRKLELPMEVDSANIAAQFDNGVLTVRVPKAAKAKPVRIPIGAAHKLIEG